ncbi:hypothetical protein [Halostella litorea]|uniref:hypothetical protein n=1 Tax=Halostella litorea TaxID=2528831 RepID=UPI00109233A6|nr:hypothetical protein [Halostella litorea]
MYAASTAQSFDPPNETDHGLNDSTFRTLWSGDEDDPDPEELANRSDAELAELAALTDIPFNAPPRAVEQWNSGDHREFPETNRTVSVHPPNTTLSDGRFVKDAYVAVFAVQPSTRAKLSRTDQPHYVAPNGSVLATADYRVAVPRDTASTERQSEWSLTFHRIAETRLLVDGAVETTAGATHTPTLTYANLDAYSGTDHTLSVETDVEVRLRHRVSVCVAGNDTATETNGSIENASADPKEGCDEWDTTVTYQTETHTVETAVDVTVYALRVSGFTGRYPNGDLGLVAYKNQPWAGYSLPGGQVQGVWRFYSARDPRWDALVYRNDDDTKTVRSPLHPLHVVAYPSETGPSSSARRNVTLLETYGEEIAPPELPEDVALDVVTDPYTGSYGIATRTKIDDPDRRNLIDSSVTAAGLVRGVSTNVTADTFAEIPIAESNLTVTLTNVTEETVTARVTLRDAETGEPIDTTRRYGAVVLAGQTVQTNESGIAVLTIPSPGGGVTARYEPGRWWQNPPSYVADSDTAYVRGTVIDVLETLYGMAIPVLTVLVAVYILDRVTGWGIWPPWRGV